MADVALRIQTHQIYTYAVPTELTEWVRPGVAVRVPYGSAGRPVEGWCVRVAQRTWSHTHRPIGEVVNSEALLTEPLLELAVWVADYYAARPGATLELMIPAPLRMPMRVKTRFVIATGVSDDRRVTARQQAVLAVLGDGECERGALLAASGATAAVLKGLVARGLIREEVRECVAPIEAPPENPIYEICAEDGFALTPGQADALAAITKTRQGDEAAFSVFLLFGVPGSGKTEVYVRAIRAANEAGRQAIVLVPEIALATQVVQRLARRFRRVAVLHSRLTPKVRATTLRQIAAGHFDVVIGTRTAVFAALPRPGVIVVDEEQDDSFKSIAAPFYHARDVAIKRGQLESIPVVLGSATPALETWSNATQRGRYRLLRLPTRVPGAQLPQVELVEPTPLMQRGVGPLISPRLRTELQRVIDAGEQAILLHNRRGYAVFLRCVECGLLVRCERCNAHLIYHRAEDVMKCHRCGWRRARPERCLDDSCGGALERTGLGIQRLEQELGETVPAARVLRLDSDTMRRREDYAAALARFEQREADVLLGTQMVAKGLDFPGVRLVGVLEADASLWMPDYRASETVFQLLVQVAGRAGRREGAALAVIQATDAGAPAVRYGVRMDYEAFATAELELRRAFFDPPFSRLVRFVCLDENGATARQAAQRLAEDLGVLAGRIDARIRVDEPAQCVIPRLREMSRYQVVVRTPRTDAARRLLHDARAQKLLNVRVKRLTVDVDPVDLL